MAVFRLSRLDAYFLTIIAGIENTERVASDFSNAWRYFVSCLPFIEFSTSSPIFAPFSIYLMQMSLKSAQEMGDSMQTSSI